MVTSICLLHQPLALRTSFPLLLPCHLHYGQKSFGLITRTKVFLLFAFNTSGLSTLLAKSLPVVNAMRSDKSVALRNVGAVYFVLRVELGGFVAVGSKKSVRKERPSFGEVDGQEVAGRWIEGFVCQGPGEEVREAGAAVGAAAVEVQHFLGFEGISACGASCRRRRWCWWVWTAYWTSSEK